jgi:hypothetical protein
MKREKYNLQFEVRKLDWKIALLYFALIKVIAKCISWNASLKNLKSLEREPVICNGLVAKYLYTGLGI